MEDLRSYQYESAIRSAKTHVKHGENVTNKKEGEEEQQQQQEIIISAEHKKKISFLDMEDILIIFNFLCEEFRTFGFGFIKYWEEEMDERERREMIGCYAELPERRSMFF